MDRDIQLAIDLVGHDSGATAAIDRVSRGVEGLGKVATAPLRAMSGLAGGLADIAKNAVGFAAGGVLMNAPGALLDMAKGAAEDERATARLATAIGNLGGDVTKHTADVNHAISAGQKLAFSDDDVRDSYIALSAATGDSDEALKRQRLAMDLARGAGIPLQAASKLLGKVTAENVDVFKRMGINLKEGATEAEAMAVIQGKFAGQADAYAQSTAGQFEQAQLAFAETQESIGAMLLPALTAVGNVLVQVLPAVQDFVGGLAGGISEKVGPAIEMLTGFVTDAIDALAIMFGLDPAAYGSAWESLGDIFGKVGDIIGKAIDLAIDAIKPFLPLIQDVAEIGMKALGQLGGVFEKVLAGDIPGAIKDFLGIVGDTQLAIVDQMLAWGKAFVEWIVPMIPGLLKALGEFTQEMLTFVAGQVSKLVEHLAEWAASFIDWIGPQIPGLLRELGAFVASMFDWLVGQLPTIMAKLAEWGLAFVEWVAPRIPPLLLELGKLSLEIVGWILTHAIPAVVEALAKLAVKFIEWVATDVLPKLPGELAKIGTAIQGWIADAAAAAGRAAQSIGTSIVQGIVDGFNQLKGWLGQQAANLAQSAIAAAERALRPGSPSKETAERIGIPFVLGIGKGMNDTMPWLLDAATSNMDAMLKKVAERVDAGAKLSVEAWRRVATQSVDAYIAEIDKGTELSQNAWRRVMSGGGLNPNLVQTPSTPGDPWGEGGGGGGGGGDRPDTGGTYTGPALSDPLYAQLFANAGWHSQVPGKGPLGIDGIAYDPLLDTERGHGTAGTNKDKSGHYRVLYRINSLLHAGQETNVLSALRSAIEWVRQNTPSQYWGGLGWTIDGRARGGPVWPGRSYLVGERGPELLSMGSRAGQVTPMGGAVYNITVNVAGSVATEGRIVDSIHAGLLRKQRLNGSLGLA